MMMRASSLIRPNKFVSLISGPHPKKGLPKPAEMIKTAKVEGRSHHVVLNTLSGTKQYEQILRIYHCLNSSYLTIRVCFFLK